MTWDADLDSASETLMRTADHAMYADKTLCRMVQGEALHA